jgi:hypothetical protein
MRSWFFSALIIAVTWALLETKDQIEQITELKKWIKPSAVGSDLC